jgi:hypothetical protein
MGKLLPTPYPGQSMDEYREQLVNFQKNYWSFLKPSKGGSKFIPLPPLTLIKKTKEMSSKKLSEHVEQELFDKEKRVIPSVSPEKRVKLSEGVETTPVKKKKPYYRKKYNKPTPVEVVIPKPVNNYWFIKGLLVGVVVTAIICHIIYSV